MDNDITLIIFTVVVLIFSAGVYRAVASDFRNGVRKY